MTLLVPPGKVGTEHQPIPVDPLFHQRHRIVRMQVNIKPEPVQAFIGVLRSEEFRESLNLLPGFVADARTGEPEA